jgi:hypothetical protein
MTVQINLKISDDYYNYLDKSAKKEGCLSVQEFLRNLIRRNKEGSLTKDEEKFVMEVYNKSNDKDSWGSEKELEEALDA